MLKETKNEKTILFCHIFIIGVILIGRGGEPPAPPFATPMIVTSMLFVILRFCMPFLLVRTCVHVKASLMILFCMIMLNMLYYW